MANELTIIQAVSNVGQAVFSMAASAKSLRRVKKQDLIILREKLHYLKSVCRAKGIADLTRVSLNEMDKTYQNILQRNYSGAMLDMAMDMLKLQYQMLCQNIQDYGPN